MTTGIEIALALSNPQAVLRAASAALEELRAEIARLRENNAALRALVEEAATASTITMSDDPGCFYCDHEKHTKDCPARKALGVKP